METGAVYVEVFSRPGNGYDVLGLQSDTVDVLETNSSALRSFQVPIDFWIPKKKLEGLVVSCWLFFSCLGAITRGSDFWLLVFVVCFVGSLLLFLLVRGSYYTPREVFFQ